MFQVVCSKGTLGVFSLLAVTTSLVLSQYSLAGVHLLVVVQIRLTACCVPFLANKRSLPPTERIKKASFPTATLLSPIKVLVVYPSEICFHHTVCHFTEFLQNHCRSEVILEEWQKKKIAEMGPVQWLTTQKKAVDKIIFLLSNDVNTMCDSTCDKSEGSPHENSQDLFPLAFNLFCSDLRNQTPLRKYMVVYFREADTKDEYSALSVCPKYRLMKDAPAFCTELLRVEQHMSAGKRLTACSM